MTSILSNGSNDGDNSVNSGEGSADEQTELNAEQAKLDAIAQNNEEALQFLSDATELCDEVTKLVNDQTGQMDHRFSPGNIISQTLRQMQQRWVSPSIYRELEESLRKRVDKLDIQFKSLFPRVREREAAWEAKYGRQELRSRYDWLDRSCRISSTSGSWAWDLRTIGTALVPGGFVEDEAIDPESQLVPSFGATSQNK